jgi:transposase-like protein
MPKQRTFSPEFKTKVVLDVISGTRTAADLCREHNLKPDLLSKWKAQFLANAISVFQRNESTDPAQARVAELERLAGRLTLELEVAKKASMLLRSTSTGSER